MNFMESYWNCIPESEMEYLADCPESFMNGMDEGEREGGKERGRERYWVITQPYSTGSCSAVHTVEKRFAKENKRVLLLGKSQSVLPSCGAGRSGGLGVGSRWPSCPDLSPSSREQTCWTRPTMSGSAQERRDFHLSAWFYWSLYCREMLWFGGYRVVE